MDVPMLGGSRNGHADPLLRAAQAQAQAEQQLQQVLQMTLARPAVSRRLNVALPAVATEGDAILLLIALPSGERIELPLPKMVARAMARDLAKQAEGEGEEERAA